MTRNGFAERGMELQIWPSDFGLPSIDVRCLQFLVSLFLLFLYK